MPPPFSMVCWNPCYFGRLCQENGTFAEIVWMVSLFVFSANRRNAKYQLRSLPSVNVLSSAFMRHTISSFRAFAVSKTYEIVWRSRGCSFFGARRRRREFFLRGTCATQRFVVLSARSFDRIPFHIPSFFSRSQHRISMCVIGFRRLAKAFPYLRRKREVLSGHR